MNLKDKDNSKSKFKKLFFKPVKSSVTSEERCLRPEIERELRPEQPDQNRCKVLKDLFEYQLQNLSLDETAIVKLWDLTKDLIHPNKSSECRQTALIFLKKLIQTQFKNITLMRELFFLVIQNHEPKEDVKYCLAVLDALTHNGKNISHFDDKIGKFMLQLISVINDANVLRPYFDLFINIIKCNGPHLDNETLLGIMQNSCHLTCIVEDDDIGLQCLQILEMVMGYTSLPGYPLSQCVVTLCRTVNHGPYCPMSWKLMKNILNTPLGYDALKFMWGLLNDRSLYEDQQLLRGAVFHLNMNAFGTTSALVATPPIFVQSIALTVLTCFLRVLDSRQVIVTYEVILSVRKVLNKFKTKLSELMWDRICDIMSAIADNIKFYEKNEVNPERIRHLQLNFHEIIDGIENLLTIDLTNIDGDVEKIYDLIERVSQDRPETSMIKLIEYRASKITPTRPQWLQAFNEFVRRFYINQQRVSIRIKAIECLMQIIRFNSLTYEEEILERVILPNFALVVQEPNLQIRIAVQNAFVEFVRQCDTKRCTELLDILEKLINRPFEEHKLSGGTEVAIEGLKPENNISDIISTLNGLMEIFIIKLHRTPTIHALKIFNILIGHLELHYQGSNKIPEDYSYAIRFQLLNLFVKMRVNASYHVGFMASAIENQLDISSIIKYSNHISVDVSNATHHTGVPNAISMRRFWKVIAKCLECEQDYKITRLVLKELPALLQNRRVVHSNDLEALAIALFKMGDRPSANEFQVFLLPVVASLASYHELINSQHHYTIISFITSGIFSSIGNFCIETLTCMILEMPNSLMRTLPDILVQISKLSDTSSIAVSVLEFLSILSSVPDECFVNFISRHYKYVFAIALPYTTPQRYDHYTVLFAHHVIAAWFIKCKLDLRKSFVSFIISSLQTNANMLMEENQHFPINKPVNEDSSNRKRSVSLIERGSRIAPTVRNGAEMRPLMNEILKNFHADLIETCVDFLARHTFSPCSSSPTRLPSVDFLLKGGLSQTWILGHNLITVTTSACPFALSRVGFTSRNSLKVDKSQSLTSTGGTSSSDDMSILTNSFSLASLKGSIDSNQSQSCLLSSTGWAEILIRRPTGNVSWIMRIQNPIPHDCFDQDLHFSNIVSLFLPSSHGGVLGESECSSAPSESVINDPHNDEIVAMPVLTTATPKAAETHSMSRQNAVSTARTLQRQEEVQSPVLSIPSSSSAITIPSKGWQGRREKEGLAGSVSDSEADADDRDGNDDPKRPRNPVRRVNSSPDMSSSWREHFLANKPAHLSEELATSKDLTDFCQHEEIICKQQKKKSIQYTKDLRVSFEAIPEEIAQGAGINAGSNIRRFDSPIKDAVEKEATMVVGDERNADFAKIANKLGKSNSETNPSSSNELNCANTMRGRSKTISVAREVNGEGRPISSNIAASITTNSSTLPTFSGFKPQLNTKLCMNPSFVFMQLYHSGQLQGKTTPIKVPTEHEKFLSLVDLTPPFDSHNIGILYVGRGQNNNIIEILRNTGGSLRYSLFLRNIGTLISLKDAHKNNIFVAMDTNGADGKFVYIWKDEISHVTFHAATMMPNNIQLDPNCNEKKKHIGNDFVNIIYNDSGEEYNFSMISGQYNYACVIVEPLDNDMHRVFFKARPEIEKFVCHSKPKIVSDRNVSLLVRQMATNANRAALVFQSLQKKQPHGSNCVERLRLIKRLRARVAEAQRKNTSPPTAAGNSMSYHGLDAHKKHTTDGDFTYYT